MGPALRWPHADRRGPGSAGRRCPTINGRASRSPGRIVSRRIQGKVHFLDLWDWSGKPVKKLTKSDVEGKHEQTEILDWSSRVQVMLGQKQVGELGWKLAQELDLGDLIGIEGGFGKTRKGEPTIFADKLTY